MKRFISGGFITNNDLIENSNCNNNDIDIDKLREKEKEQEDEGFNISNFYKTSTFSLNAKLPERLLKRLPEISKQHSEIIDNNLNLSKTTTNIITTTTTTTTTTEITKKNSFYCCECESEIFNTEKIEHESSTTHILCVRTKEGFVPKRYVSSSLPLNVGYNILSKNMNWCDGEGLGKNNEGKINPIKVEKKNNKLGLGVTTKNNNQVLNYNNNKNNKNNKNNNNIGNYQNKKKKKETKRN